MIMTHKPTPQDSAHRRGLRPLQFLMIRSTGLRGHLIQACLRPACGMPVSHTHTDHHCYNREFALKCLILSLTIISIATGCSTSSLPPKVIFIGDSITQLWGDTEFSQAFAENTNWIDKGVGGQNSSQILARFQSDVIDAHPEIVHILAGTNDVYPGWQLCRGTAINSCANIEAMVTEAQAAGIRVILGTIPPWGPGAVPEEADPSPARYTRITEWNDWLEQYGKANAITVLDYHSVLQAANGDQYVSSLTSDGVHPSAAGFALMTPLAEQAITKPYP
jgi:lysophospholipase L1-like esterase